MDWKEKKQHRTRVVEDSERYRDRQDQKEREKQEHKAAVKTRKQHVERNVLHEAHGFPPIPPNPRNPHAPCSDKEFRSSQRERPPRSDLGTKYRKPLRRPQPPTALPKSNNNDASSDDSSTRRAATLPIYEGGMTTSTRAIAPAKCPECYCEGCHGCTCMCPMGKDISSPPAPSAVGTTVLDALVSAPKARC
ncbi:hypothetical protein B0H14DRAFT_2641466 [Mycena olivaceomarginata]|nr:hypothetical protein B0H14DRAFT_2641466 [Mycena olivaceomarginata]